MKTASTAKKGIPNSPTMKSPTSPKKSDEKVKTAFNNALEKTKKGMALLKDEKKSLKNDIKLLNADDRKSIFTELIKINNSLSNGHLESFSKLYQTEITEIRNELNSSKLFHSEEKRETLHHEISIDISVPDNHERKAYSPLSILLVEKEETDTVSTSAMNKRSKKTKGTPINMGEILIESKKEGCYKSIFNCLNDTSCRNTWKEHNFQNNVTDYIKMINNPDEIEEFLNLLQLKVNPLTGKEKKESLAKLNYICGPLHIKLIELKKDALRVFAGINILKRGSYYWSANPKINKHLNDKEKSTPNGQLAIKYDELISHTIELVLNNCNRIERDVLCYDFHGAQTGKTKEMQYFYRSLIKTALNKRTLPEEPVNFIPGTNDLENKKFLYADIKAAVDSFNTKKPFQNLTIKEGIAYHQKESGELKIGDNNGCFAVIMASTLVSTETTPTSSGLPSPSNLLKK